jgi:hypothetical protein
MSFPLYGNIIADASKHTGLGGTLTITNSCKSTSLNNQASIAFGVADISFDTIKRGFFRNNVDSADARITAVIDTVSPTVGTAMTFKVSSDHSIEPREALRVRSNGNVGIGTQTPQFSLDVTGDINFTGNLRQSDNILIPTGVIVLWSGASNAIPGGWTLCNGTNSTPDLRNRFIVGAGSTYNVNVTGGSPDAIVVSHSHTATSTSSSSSSSTSTVTDPGHAHNFSSRGDDGVGSGWGFSVVGFNGGGTPGSGNMNNANTGITVGTSTSTNTSTITSINNTGSSGTNANLPPYYALCYIMKT